MSKKIDLDIEQVDKPTFVKRDLSVVGDDYVHLLHELKEKYRNARIKAAVKVNTGLLEFYWEMGRRIAVLYSTSKYGSAFFDSLSLDLRAEFPNDMGFSSSNIRYVYRWYCFYNQGDTILHQLGEELEMPIEFGLIPWKHHVLIFTKSKNVEEALFYVKQTIDNSWSRRQLELMIEDNFYIKQGKAITNFSDQLPAPQNMLANSILKSKYNFEFLHGDFENERQLEDALAKDITRFLLELGRGFAYVGRQMELSMPSGQTFIPDMIFYHTRLKAYIVIELKVVPFIPEYAGKLNFYVSAVDELLKQSDDNPTIGLLICKSKDDTIVEWSFRGMSTPLGVAEYERNNHLEDILPSAKDIQNIIDVYHPE